MAFHQTSPETEKVRLMLSLLDLFEDDLHDGLSATYGVIRSSFFTTLQAKLSEKARAITEIEKYVNSEIKGFRILSSQSSNSFRHFKRWKRVRQCMGRVKNAPFFLNNNISKLLALLFRKTGLITHSSVRKQFSSNMCASPSREIVIQFLVNCLAHIIKYEEIRVSALSSASSIVDSFQRHDFALGNSCMFAIMSRIYALFNGLLLAVASVYNLMMSNIIQFCPQATDEGRDCPKKLKNYLDFALLPLQIDFQVASSVGFEENRSSLFDKLVEVLETNSSRHSPLLPIVNAKLVVWDYRGIDTNLESKAYSFGVALQRAPLISFQDSFYRRAEVRMCQASKILKKLSSEEPKSKPDADPLSDSTSDSDDESRKAAPDNKASAWQMLSIAQKNKSATPTLAWETQLTQTPQPPIHTQDKPPSEPLPAVKAIDSNKQVDLGVAVTEKEPVKSPMEPTTKTSQKNSASKGEKNTEKPAPTNTTRKRQHEPSEPDTNIAKKPSVPANNASALSKVAQVPAVPESNRPINEAAPNPVAALLPKEKAEAVVTKVTKAEEMNPASLRQGKKKVQVDEKPTKGATQKLTSKIQKSNNLAKALVKGKPKANVLDEIDISD